MSKLVDHVNPGDLILANLFNLLLDGYSTLDDRVTALESGTVGNGVVITGLSATSVQVGQTLTVSGRNFAFSVGSQQVLIDAFPVNAFQAGSSDTQLVFTVPTTINDVPAQGRSAVLSVGNGSSTAKQNIFLMPPFVLTGGVDVNYVGPVTGAITAGQAAVFQYAIKSQANLNATFTIQPVITANANAAAFNANLQVLDDTKTVLPAKTIQLFAGEQKTFFVSINPVPAGSAGTFDFAVNAASGAFSGGSPPQTLTVGQAAPQPDTTITVNFSSAAFLPPGGGSASQSQVSLKAGSQAKITFQTVFTVAGSYDITAVLTSGSNWAPTLFAQTTVTPVVIAAADLANPAGAANRLLDFIISPGAAASAAGKVEFRVKNQAVATLRAYPMDLVLTQ
jgi:hypothetical protein